MNDFLKKCTDAGHALGTILKTGDGVLAPEHVLLCEDFVNKYGALMASDDLARYCRALCRSHENLRTSKLLVEIVPESI